MFTINRKQADLGILKHGISSITLVQWFMDAYVLYMQQYWVAISRRYIELYLYDSTRHKGHHDDHLMHAAL